MPTLAWACFSACGYASTSWGISKSHVFFKSGALKPTDHEKRKAPSRTPFPGRLETPTPRTANPLRLGAGRIPPRTTLDISPRRPRIFPFRGRRPRTGPRLVRLPARRSPIDDLPGIPYPGTIRNRMLPGGACRTGHTRALGAIVRRYVYRGTECAEKDTIQASVVRFE